MLARELGGVHIGTGSNVGAGAGINAGAGRGAAALSAYYRWDPLHLQMVANYLTEFLNTK